MLIKVTCPYCGSDNLEQHEIEYMDSGWGDFLCNNCDADIYFDELDYEIVKKIEVGSKVRVTNIAKNEDYSIEYEKFVGVEGIIKCINHHRNYPYEIEGLNVSFQKEELELIE